MAGMKKHQFLHIDWQSSVKLTTAERKKLEQWFEFASCAVERLFQEGVFFKKDLRQLKTVKVSLLICGDARIKTLNVNYRNKNKITDVLSFPAHEDLRRGIPSSAISGGELFLGDLALCFPQSKRQARNFNIGVWDEFIHLFFHGMLHLIGFDHEISAKEEKLMQKQENKSLELFSLIKNKK
jgi:probable rRNA maturation factor